MRTPLWWILLLGALTGCSHWAASDQPAPVLLAEPKRPDRLRLTLLDGRRVDVSEPSLRNDSLIGNVPLPGPQGSASRVSIAVPLRSVRLVERRRFDPLRTIALSAGLMVSMSLLEQALSHPGLSVPIPCGWFGEHCPP